MKNKELSTDLLTEKMNTPLVVAAVKEPNPQEMQIVENILKGINIKDTNSIISFGIEAQESITDFTDTILDTVKTKDLSGAGENLQKMIDEMQSIDFSSIKATDGFIANLPIIGAWAKKGIRSFVGDFETVSDKVVTMASTLKNQAVVISKDISILDELFDNNLDFVRKLELFIIAGTQKLEELKQEVKELQEIAKASQDPLDSQQYSDLAKAVERFDKRINNLKISRMVAIQAAVQIRLAQESDKMIVEDITDIVHNTVPMWKRQFVVAISLAKQEKALKISKTVKDFTNKQYLDNATKLNALMDQVNESFARGILDIDVMKEVNKMTIDTIKKSLDTHKIAKGKRAEAEKELILMEEDLKKALLDASNKTEL